MHFLYHSYCYAVLSGCLLLLVLGQSLFVPQALQGGVGKGVWVWGKVDNFTKKKENKKPFLRNMNENQRENLRKQTG